MPIVQNSTQRLISRSAGSGSSSDYRPISVTSVLSRLTERHIVQTCTSILHSKCPHQHCFPTSTRSGRHTFGDMLSSSNCVYVIAFDFSKAFDSVRHVTLMVEIASLTLPDEVYNWMRHTIDQMWRTASILKSRKIAMSQQRFDQSPRSLAW